MIVTREKRHSDRQSRLIAFPELGQWAQGIVAARNRFRVSVINEHITAAIKASAIRSKIEYSKPPKVALTDSIRTIITTEPI